MKTLRVVSGNTVHVPCNFLGRSPQVMVATRSKDGWSWLIWLAPAMEMMLFAAFAAQSKLGQRNGELTFLMLSKHDVDFVGLNIINLPVAVAISLGLGIWRCWEKPFRLGGVLAGMGFGLVVAIGNIFVAFVGCVVGSTLLGF